MRKRAIRCCWWRVRLNTGTTAPAKPSTGMPNAYTAGWLKAHEMRL